MRNNGFRSAVNYLYLNSPDEITTQQIRTSQLSALVPLEGKIVYNTDTDKLLYYTNGTWREVSVDLGNFAFSGNTITVTNTNGSIILSPLGTGTVQLTKSLNLGRNNILDIDSMVVNVISNNSDLSDNILIIPGASGYVGIVKPVCDSVTFTDNVLSTFVANTNLVLSANGTGVVELQKGLICNSNTISGISTLTATTLSGTLSTAAQTNITSLGTLTALRVDNINLDLNTISTTNTNGNLILAPNGTGVVQLSKALNANSQNITGVGTLSTSLISISSNDISVPINTNISLTMSGTGFLLVGSHIVLPTKDITGVSTLTALNITGTLTTAAQPNITSLGTITTLNAGTVSATTLTGTLSTAAQTNVTSLGTLTALNVDNINLDLNTISTTNTNGNLILAPNGTGVVQLSKALNANSQNITNVATITATTFTGTLSTAAQPNITSLGTLTALTVDSVNIDGSIINHTDTGAHLTIQTNSTLGVRINNLKMAWCQITTTGTYFTQNINLTGMAMTSSSSYSLYTLTSGTTLTASETVPVFMMMTATLNDDVAERYGALELYENGVFIVAAAGGITIGEVGTNFASLARGMALTLTAGRSYTWRFSSINNGTANLSDLVVFVMRI
jgi:hypothetical protein